MRTIVHHPLALALAAGVSLLITTTAALAQAPEFPQASPKARTEQRVGVTDFAIDYSSPAVKGRTIWGDVVPYDKTWRAGANAPTKLTASRDFTIGGTVVKAGAYAVFIIPSKAGAWTVAFNTDIVNQFDYDTKKDVARVQIKPQAVPAVRERLLWYFTDTTEARTSLDLEWEKIRLRVPLDVDTAGHAAASIEKATGDAWRPHFAAASYLLDSGGDLGKALGLVDKSIAIQETWRNVWLRAQILGKKGNKADAVAAATRAQTLAKDDKLYLQFFKDNIAKAIAGWK